MALRHTIDAAAAADLDETGEGAPYPSRFAKVMVGGAPAFSTIERNVILFARRDPLASLTPPGPIRQMILWLLGTRSGSSQLADPRLEALRRAVVVTCHRRHLPDRVAADLRAWGYGEQQIRMVETLALRA